MTERENILFVTLVLAALVPLWTVSYFPSQDGPAHLGNAAVLREYYGPERTAFRTYYVLNETFTPNWAGHLILAGLLSLLPPLLAQQVFLTGYVVLLPVAIRYAVGAVRPHSAFLGVLGFPFVYSYPFHMGFFSFCYSLAMCLFVVGYWLRRRQRLGAQQTVVLAVLAMILYFSHLVSLVAACIAIGVMIGWAWLLRRVPRLRPSEVSGSAPTANPVLRPVLALAPACLLAALFLLWNEQTYPSWDDSPPFPALVKNLLSLHSLVSFDRRELWISRLMVCLFAGITLYLLAARRVLAARSREHGFLLLAAVYSLIYLLGPSAVSNGSYLQERVGLYPFFAVILWFGAHSFGRTARGVVQAAGVGLTAVLLTFHAVRHHELEGYLAEYLWGSRLIAPNATVLPIVFSAHGDAPDLRPLSLRIDLFLNAGGYIAAERGIVDLGNYQASQTPFFPLLFRRPLNPAEQLEYAPLDSASGDFRAIPTALLQYPRRTGGTIDYVLVWGVRARDRQREVPRGVFSQLREGYDLISTSEPRGLAGLYRRKTLGLDSVAGEPQSSE